MLPKYSHYTKQKIFIPYKTLKFIKCFKIEEFLI